MAISDPGEFLRRLFDRAVEVADPMRSLAAHLPPRPQGRVLVIGAGKASARMAEAVEAAWGPCDGLVITRYGYARPCQGIEIIEASHPVPDQAGLEATQRLLALVSGLGPEDFVLVLISGGASSLLVAPVGDLSLDGKQQVTQALLASGAPISAMNVVRKHLSRVKGGQLAAACHPARLLALMISDVPGDDPAFIGSGPTVGDTSTTDDARGILERWQVPMTEAVRRALAGSSGVIPPGDDRLARVENRVVAAPAQSLAAAGDLAREAGCELRFLGDALEGESRDGARMHAKLALEIAAARKPGDPPVLLLSGGEYTVTRRGKGVGGRNSEFALALALALDGASGIHAIACDTDGVDGGAEVAGSVVTPQTLALARSAGIDPDFALTDNDAHGFFEAIGGQVVTGPTLTNVNDFRAILIS